MQKAKSMVEILNFYRHKVYLLDLEIVFRMKWLGEHKQDIGEIGKNSGHVVCLISILLLIVGFHTSIIKRDYIVKAPQVFLIFKCLVHFGWSI